MFKSIQYKLIIYLLLLVGCVAAGGLMAARSEWIWACVATVLAVYFFSRLAKHYKRFNDNILFLLNALENGDYSFSFSTSRVSRREKELNSMMNRIKDILTAAREQVMQNERFLSLIVESVSTGMIMVEHNHSVKAVNRAALDLLGMGVFTHLNQLSVIDPEYPGIFGSLAPADSRQIKVLNEREEISISLKASVISIDGRPLRIITMNNIGNELEAKEMESWMKLIRIMTHEIMNSVAPISSLSEMLLDNHRSGIASEGAIEALETIGSTARGLITFVDSYRRFTGMSHPDMSDVDLNLIVQQAVTLNDAILRERNIHMSVDEASTTVQADAGQVRQVFVNLIKNGAEAVGKGGGEIRISFSRSTEQIFMDVANDGKPVDPENLPHIFIPFFTTKDSGSGIGLSLSRYIMRLHGGNLRHFRSGKWTVFRVSFPMKPE